MDLIGLIYDICRFIISINVKKKKIDTCRSMISVTYHKWTYWIIIESVDIVLMKLENHELN